MVVELNTMIEIIIGIIIIGGAVISFFVMQKGQNMKLEQLKKEVDELKQQQSLSMTNQTNTEKDLIAINVKLDHILEAIEDLKNSGHP